MGILVYCQLPRSMTFSGLLLAPSKHYSFHHSIGVLVHIFASTMGWLAI